VVRRKLWNWRAAQAIRTQASGDAATHRLLEQQAAPADDQTVWEAEWQDRLFAWACAQVRPEVTDPTWQAFWRTAVEGRPGRQVAAELGLSITAVYSARSRVLSRLRQLIHSVQEP
jgi:RNA polymerase sigma-70 factor (ECF subfamily)